MAFLPLSVFVQAFFTGFIASISGCINRRALAPVFAYLTAANAVRLISTAANSAVDLPGLKFQTSETPDGLRRYRYKYRYKNTWKKCVDEELEIRINAKDKLAGKVEAAK